MMQKNCFVVEGSLQQCEAPAYYQYVHICFTLPDILSMCLTKEDLSYIYLVKGLQTIAFGKQCQHSLLLGRFEADQCKLCEFRRLGIAPCVPYLFILAYWKLSKL